MLLTTKQVAQKLGVHPRVVRSLIKRGKLTPAFQPKPGAKKTEWEFDQKQVREFATTYVPIIMPKRTPKAQPVTLNGHTQELPGLGFSDHVAERLSKIDNYLIATRVELGDRTQRIESKLSALHALVEALLEAWQ